MSKKLIELPEEAIIWGGECVRVYYDFDSHIDVVEKEYVASKIAGQTRQIVQKDGLSWYGEEYGTQPYPFVEIFGERQASFRTMKKVITHIRKHKNIFFIKK